MTSSETSQPLMTLSNFFNEMNAWETNYYPEIISMLESGTPQHEVLIRKEAARNQLSLIYEKYGIAGAKNRGRIESLQAGEPPAYENSPKVIETLEENDSAAIYLVDKPTTPQGIYKYTLKNKKGDWTLAKREFLDYEDRWRQFSF